MTDVYPRESVINAIHHESGNAAASSAANWLSLAATPTFALMALLTGVDSGQMLCAPAQHALPLNGMAAMYLLMSAFHSTPWLKLISNRRNGTRQS
jgi:hypothetical protein